MSIRDSCHNITIGEDKLSNVFFCQNIFIVLLICKSFTYIFDDIILVNQFDIILFDLHNIAIFLFNYIICIISYSIRTVLLYSTISISVFFKCHYN